MFIERKLLDNSIVNNAPAETQASFQGVLDTLNPLISDLSRLTHKRLSFADNIACAYRSVTFTYPEVDLPGTFLNGVSNWASGQRLLSFHKHDGWVTVNGFLKHSPSGGLVEFYQYPDTYKPLLEESYIPCTVDKQPAAFTVEITGKLRLDYIAAGTSANKAISIHHTYRAADPTSPRPTGQFPITVDVTELNTRPSACLVVKTEIIADKKPGTSPPAVNVVWSTTTNGKNDIVRIDDFEGLIPGNRYRVGLLFLP